MDVSIIYVNWNSEAEILRSVQSVRTHVHGVSYEILAVDNNSAQGVALLASEPGIRLIKNTKNSGFGAGCNKGAQHSSGDFLFFLNPDTRLENDVPTILSAFLRHSATYGIAGPLVLDAHGQIQYGGARMFLSLSNEFLEHSALTFRFPQGRFTGKPYYSFWDHQSTRQVEAILGAALMIKRDVFFELHGFDEQFFLYCEEIDLCHRAFKRGYSTHYVHNAQITHYEKQSSNQYFENFHSLILQHLQSTQIYMKKHYGFIHTLLWRIMLIVLYALKTIRRKDLAYLKYCKFGFLGNV